MSEQNQTSFEGWAKVEVMGHQTHIGFVRTEAYGQAVMFRVDQPEIPAQPEYVLEWPAYVEGKWTAAGAKVQRPAIQGCSVLVGAGSIYRILPCTEAAALKAIQSEQRSELKLIEPPPAKGIEAPAEARRYTCCAGNTEEGHVPGCNFEFQMDYEAEETEAQL